MKSFLFVLFAGCALSPVVAEEESRLLIGGPEFIQQEEASLSLEPTTINAVGIVNSRRYRNRSRG